jgi:hypothetical protein
MTCKGVGGKTSLDLSRLPARQKRKNKQMTNARKIRNHDYVVNKREQLNQNNVETEDHSFEENNEREQLNLFEQSGISLTDGMENLHIFLSSGNEGIQINGEVDESLSAFEFKEDDDLEFREDLAKTFLTCKTPHKHIEKILGVLRKNCHPKLPLTARTLLKTVRKASLQTSNMAYFGLEKGILIKIKVGLKPSRDGYQVIKLQFNIDGIPLHRSTNKSFWVISCRVVNSVNDYRHLRLPFFVVVPSRKVRKNSLILL